MEIQKYLSPEDWAEWFYAAGMMPSEEEIKKKLAGLIHDAVAVEVLLERDACLHIIESEIKEIEALPYSQQYRYDDDLIWLRRLAQAIRDRGKA